MAVTLICKPFVELSLMLLFHFSSKNTEHWFQILNFEDFLLFFVIYGSKENTFGLWTL